MLKVHALALQAAGRDAYEYSCGVLGAVGHPELAIELRSLNAAAQLAAKQMEDALPPASKAQSFEQMRAGTKDPAFLQARAISIEAEKQLSAAWDKVDALVQKARETVGTPTQHSSVSI